MKKLVNKAGVRDTFRQIIVGTKDEIRCKEEFEHERTKEKSNLNCESSKNIIITYSSNKNLLKKLKTITF